MSKIKILAAFTAAATLSALTAVTWWAYKDIQRMSDEARARDAERISATAAPPPTPAPTMTLEEFNALKEQQIIDTLPENVREALRAHPDRNLVLQSVMEAERKTHCPAELIICMMYRESSFDFDETTGNKIGCLQINYQTTAIEMIYHHADKLGLSHLKHTVDSVDRVAGSGQRRRDNIRTIINALHDPHIAACLTGAQLEANTMRVNEHLFKKGLTPTLRRIEETPYTDIYMTHLLGCTGAKKMLFAYYNPKIKNGWRASDYANPSAVSRNRNLFFTKNGQNYSIHDFYDSIAKTMPITGNDKAPAPAPAPAPAQAPTLPEPS